MKHQFLAVALICAPLALHAQKTLDTTTAPVSRATRQQAGEILLRILKLDSLMPGVLEKEITMMVNKDDRMRHYEPVVRRYMTRYVSWTALRGSFNDLCTRPFTDAELQELYAFSTSPTGRKVLPEIKKLEPLSAEEMGDTAVIAHYRRIYAGFFTETELQQLLTFLQTPVSQKMRTLTSPAYKEGIDEVIAHGRQQLLKHSDELK